MVELPIPGEEFEKVAKLIRSAKGVPGTIPVKSPLRARGDAVIRDILSASPKAAMNAPIAAQGRPQSRTEAQKAGAEAKQARRKAEEDKVREKVTKSMAQKWPGVKQPELPPEQLQPLRGPAAQGTGGNANWKQEFSGRTEKLDLALNKLQDTINSQPPEQQAYWNAQVSKNFGLKGDKEDAIIHSSGRKKGQPYTPEEVNQALTSQANGWTRIINDGAPKVLEDRQKGRFPAPANMSPNTTFTGQRKWINPEDDLVYSAPKNAADRREGLWGQNRASKKDTTRHVPAITEFRKTREAAGQAWPAQSLPPRPDMPKSVDEVINGLTATQRRKILENGLDASSNEGLKLREYYKANPKEADARVREVVERWYAQGGRSGVSGKPVALPGLDPKPGESRSSVDHQTPLSTDRRLNPSALQTRKTLDKFENFLIAEEGPNTNREAVPWGQWHDNIVAGRRRKDTSATVNEGAARTPRATKKKAEAEDTNYDNWNEIKKGNYGKINVSPDGNRAVKTLLTGPDGKEGQFGPHEVELATKMGQLGHSPRVYKATDRTMEMDRARGDTLWKDYKRGENEPAMNAAQATKAVAAIRDLHKLGFYHGDNHALQYLVDGDNVKMVDFGLSGPISGNPVRVMQDLSKIATLVKWDNPELAGNPYVQIVNRHLPAYREVKGTSKAAKAEKERIAQAYLADLANLQ